MQVDAQSSCIGFLEPFLYSKDRHNLLNTLVEDTEERIYYELIQLDNEIEYVLKSDANNQDKTNKLLKQFENISLKIKENKSLKNSSKINKLLTRNDLRFIEYNDKRSRKGWKTMKEKLNWKPSHKKPKKKRLAQSLDDIQYKSVIDCLGVDDKLLDRFKHCVKHSSSFASHFEYNSINYLISDDKIKMLTPFLISQILSWDSAIYIAEHKLFKLIQLDLKKNKISFGSRNIHNKLTLSQLNKLYDLNIDSLPSNQLFLEQILKKSQPKCLMRYHSFHEWAANAPRTHKVKYNEIIKNFIIKHLPLSIDKHQRYKCALLHYLIQQQYDTNGTFNADLFIQYLRIPKRRSYNLQIWQIYDSYNNRYIQQEKKLKYKQQQSKKEETNQNDEGEKGKNKPELLEQIEFIGSQLSGSPVPSNVSFADFACNDGQELIKRALAYFFANPEKTTDELSDELKQAIDEDTDTLNRLKAEYKLYAKQQKKKLLSELQQRQFTTQRLQQQRFATNNNAMPQQIAPWEQQQAYEEAEEEDYEESGDAMHVDEWYGMEAVEQKQQYIAPSPPPTEKEEKEEKEMAFIDSRSLLVVKYFAAYISVGFLLTQQSEYELLSGDVVTRAQSYRSLIKLKSNSYVQTLKDSVIIKYDKFKNARKYSIDDDVVLTVTLKNVKKLLLKVFKMNTTPYFKKNKSEVASDLNLEGLSSKTLDKEILVDIANEFQVHDLKIPLPALQNRRGLYFVDVIGNGTHSRAIIRKGDFKYVERRSAAGHVLRLLDERHSVVLQGNVWIDGKTYASNDKGDIYVPYSASTGATKIICSSPQLADYSVLAELERKCENYRLETSFYVDRESLLEKQESKVIVKNALFINACQVSLKLLKAVTLDLSITSLQGVTVTRKFSKFKVTDLEDSVASFALPGNPRTIKFVLTCKCRKTDGSYQNFQRQQTFSINAIDTGKGIATAHLIPGGDGSYVIYILGKNGEPIPNVVCSLTYKFFQLKASLSKTAQSDKNGRIMLPDMNGIKSLSINCAGYTENYSFPLNKCLSPSKICVNQHTAFKIAYFSDTNVSEKAINWKLFDVQYAFDYSEQIEYENGLFVCDKGLSAGSYVLHADYHHYKCLIYVTAADNIVQMHRTRHAIENDAETFTVLSNNNPLQIVHIDQTNKDKMRIKINGARKELSCRIHVILTHKYPSFPIFNQLKQIPLAEVAELTDFNSAPSVYTSQRTISEEYRYVLERVSAKKYIGNMLAKPTLLLRPWSSRATKTQTQDAAKGDKMEHKTYRKRRRRQIATLASHHSANMSESGAYSTLEFLTKSPSKSLVNLQVGKDGFVDIDKSLIDDNHTFVTVVASDNERWSIRTAALIKDADDTKSDADDTKSDVLSFKYSEVRLFPGLDIKKHFTEQREIVLLFDENDVFKVTNFKNSQCEVYVTLRDVFSLFSTSSNNATLEQFSFLLYWDDLSPDKKLKKLNNFFCHETNFYLYCKYRAFFDEQILPFLQNKIEKSFMDYFLLNDVAKLWEFSSFGEFNKLNALEQILLAYTFKNDEDKSYITSRILNYFREKNKSQKISPSQLQEIFKTALADRHYADAMRKMAEEQKEERKTRSENLSRRQRAHEHSDLLVSSTSNFDARFLNESVVDSNINVAPQQQMLYDQMAQQQQQYQYQVAQQQMAQQPQQYQMAQQQQMAQMAQFNHQQRRMGQQRKPPQRPQRHSRRRSITSSALSARLNSVQSAYNAAPISSAISHGPSGGDTKLDVDDDEEEEEADPFDLDLRYREIGTSFFEELENTKEYQECHYYKIAWKQQTSHLVPVNKFWCDFAEHLLADRDDEKKNVNSKKAFLSKHFFLATTYFTEMVFALSVLDLPVSIENESKAAQKKKNLDTLEMTVSCSNASIIFSQQLKETAISTSSTIHVAVYYFDPDDIYAYIDDERVDKFVSCDSFEPTKIYGCRAIITNSSSAQQNVEVLYQIPTGSIAVKKGLNTKTEFISIGSYSGKNLEFYFYFPQPGKFNMFPVQISKKGRVLGFGETKEIIVSFPTESKEIDINSWEQVSIAGDPNDVLNYLNNANHNLYDTDLSRIYWRLDDVAFFKALTKLLRAAGKYDGNVWRYSLKHQQLSELGEILERNGSFNNRYFQPSFYSSWYQFDSIKNKSYSYLEYYPLINARSHQLGKKRRINNVPFKSQYKLFLEYAIFQAINIQSLPIHILLQSVYYLLLQDRIDESIEIFTLISPQKIALLYHVQYDYLRAYLNIYDEQDMSCKSARNVVSKYKKIKYLSENKKKLIADIESQLSELQLEDDSDDETKDDHSDDLEEEEISEKERLQKLIQPSFDFEIRDRNIQFSYHKISKIKMNFYKMDIELLFSMSPFLRSNNDIFSYIQPNETLIIDLPSDANVKLFNVSIPPSLQHTNMYISATSMVPGDVTSPKSQAFYDHQLIVEIKDRFGVLRVLDREQWINVQKAYVKVYALVAGQAKFHKDGYTDRRGQFDYVSVSSQHLTKTSQFAILIATKKYGSMVKIVQIPSDLITRRSSTTAAVSGKPRKEMERKQKRGFTKKKVRRK